jgi:hypothetical protein
MSLDNFVLEVNRGYFCAAATENVYIFWTTYFLILLGLQSNTKEVTNFIVAPYLMVTERSQNT